MSKARLRKVLAILEKLRKKTEPALSNLIIYTDEADCERQLAAWKEKGGTGAVICLPDNGREPPGDYEARRKALLAGTSYDDPPQPNRKD